MSDSDDADSRTEEPTEKKIHDALERGDTPTSREIPILASLTAILLALLFAVPARTQALAATLVRFIDDPSGWRLQSGEDALDLLGIVVAAAAAFVGPIAALLMICGVVASLAQNAPRIVPDRIAPDLSRLSLRKGLRRIFGPRGWTEFAKSGVKICVVGIAAGIVLGGQKSALLTAVYADVGDLPQRIVAPAARIVSAVLVATLVVASVDLASTRLFWRRDQRMSRHEIKEELKQSEGDRMMKARMRSLRLDRSRKRMLSAVPRATMVIVNPTHYAVALRYVRTEGGAPLVLAKGVDLIALRIRAIAEESAIPIVEDRLLARSLYDAVAVDSVIPPEFYRAVASLVHLIAERSGSWPINRNRTLS